MTLVRAKSVLWRRWNNATFDTLHGRSAGQYDIRLTRLDALEGFLAGNEKADETELGGFTVAIPVEGFDGDPPVGPDHLGFRYMGERSARADWYIRAQRPDSAYPLWRPGRGVPAHFDQDQREYLIVVKDINGGYHARWINDESFDSIPAPLRSQMLLSEVGIMELP